MQTVDTEIMPDNRLVVRENMAVGQALSVQDIVAQVKLIQNVMREVMHDGEHYGTIPGCGDKKTLLQPGAQKLTMTFRLAPEYEIQEADLGRGHKEYRIVCSLKSIQTGNFVGEGVGVCSTMESKYRFRGGARKCPKCGKETIIKGKAEFGGGWLCWAKKGGCGEKWADGAAEIESQSIEKVENENPADTYNTVLKMAKKRAFVDATITATAASDIFTQDIGDNEEEPQPSEAPAKPRPSAPSRAPEARGGIGFAKAQEDPSEASEAILEPPAPAPEAPKLTPKQRADAFLDLLKRSKSRFLSQVKPILAPAERYFKELPIHGIMPNETLADIPASDLFPNADVEKTPEENHAAILADRNRHMAGINAILKADDQLPGAEIQDQEEDEPYDRDAPAPPVQDRKPMPAGTESKRIRLKNTSAKAGVKKTNGQPYTKYGVVDSEGNWYNHFSDSLHAACESLKGQDCVVWFKTSQYGDDLIDIQALDETL